MQIKINGKFFAQTFNVAKDSVVETAKTLAPVVKESTAVGALYTAEYVADKSIVAAEKMTAASNKLQAMIAKKAAEMQAKYSK